MITDHTVEENILVKQRQKRELDIMVMDAGNFDLKSTDSANHNEVRNFYTKVGLRAILGVSPVDEEKTEAECFKNETDALLSNDQIEQTMTSLEDMEDVNALQGARKEAAEEFKEFDESIEYKKDSDVDEDADNGHNFVRTSLPRSNKADESKCDEKEMEMEFAVWQKRGMDASTIESSLTPMERYGLRFRKEVDPYYSVFAVMEYNHNIEMQEEHHTEIDIDEIEREKSLEEELAFDQGDLLATNPNPEHLVRQRNLYYREKARLRGSKKKRKLTGDDWECREEALSKQKFWYNIDTGEALWDKPKVLCEMEEYELAYQKGWSALPYKNLLYIMQFLAAFPDRMQCAAVASRWHKAASDVSFVRHVYPVELGAYTREEKKIEVNHYRTIIDAVKSASPGDTIGQY